MNHLIVREVTEAGEAATMQAIAIAAAQPEVISVMRGVSSGADANHKWKVDVARRYD